MASAVTSQRMLNAVVVSAGFMQKTVKVSIGTQQWNSHIRKHFSRTAHLLVHDPRSSLRTGDVISISSGWRRSKHVRHVVNSIIAPFGTPIEERPPVPTEAERLEELSIKKEAKAAMRRIRDEKEAEKRKEKALNRHAKQSKR
ncbi:MAG: hypothetical protein M1818_003205 [Claussenomyces sp. TS43310]|nr:MAG: hypothetical protein M1818_003205 [Claussenomyces sp. TS43310]